MPDSKALIKDNRLIQSQNVENLMDRQLLNIAFGVAQQRLQELGKVDDIEFSFPIETLEFNSNDIQQVKDSLTRLNKGIQWNIFDKRGERAWGLMNPLISPRLERSENRTGLTCHYKLDAKVLHALFQPSIEQGYGKIDLIIQRKIEKKYVLALYELALGALKSNHQAYTEWIEIEKFRAFMLGKEIDKYQDWKDFKKRCVHEPCKELSIITNIVSTSEFERERNKPVKIRFLFKVKNLNFIKAIEDRIIENIQQSEAQKPEITDKRRKNVYSPKNDNLKIFCVKNNVYLTSLKNIQNSIVKEIPIITTDDEYEDYLVFVMERVNAQKKVASYGKYFRNALIKGHFKDEYTEMKKDIEARTEAEKRRIEKRIAHTIIDNWKNIYEIEFDEYTKCFLKDAPEIINQIKQLYSNIAPFDLIVAKRLTDEQLIGNMVFLRCVRELKELKRKDFYFPDFDTWQKAPLNVLKKEDLINNAFENRDLLIRLNEEKLYHETLQGSQYYMAYKFNAMIKYLETKTTPSEIESFIQKYNDNGLIIRALDKYGIKNHYKLINDIGILSVIAPDVEARKDFTCKSFEEWKTEFEFIHSNYALIEVLREDSHKNAIKEVNLLFGKK